MNYCGLLGNNIQYSKSPSLHNTFYKKNNINLQYKLFDLKKVELPYFVKTLSNNKIIGFNVTIPFKEVIMGYLTKVHYMAERIGAVNTVVVKGDELIGYNTDYYGFIDSLKEINIKEGSALIIGNGGSAKCVYHAMKYLGVSTIDCLGRNKTKAISEMPKGCNIYEFHQVTEFSKYDIIINCTPLGGANSSDISPVELNGIRKGILVYDLNYIPIKSKFLMEAEELGALIKNGDAMFKYQGNYAIKIWCSSLNEGGKIFEDFK